MAIYPRDPLVARDGRPFGREAGSRMYCLPWPYPSVVAGSLRTMLGKAIKGRRDAFSDPGFVDQLKLIRVRGPLALYNNELYFPRPQNFLRAKTDRDSEASRFLKDEDSEYVVERLEPAELPDGWGMNLSGLWPLIPKLRQKPDLGEGLWHADMLTKWLLGDQSFVYDCKKTVRYPSVEERVHVRIDDDRRIGVDGALFVTQGLDFVWGEEQALAVQVDLPDSEWEKRLASQTWVHPVGGARRLAMWDPGWAGNWTMPKELAARLKGASRVCMYLATPAVFAGGWRPGWLDPESLEGEIHGTSLKLRLRGAAVGRWQPVSGWSYELPGPKPIRRLVPAGSVYFFDVLYGDPSDLEELWLQPLSDDEEDARDGFGLVCWGLWGQVNNERVEKK